MKCHEPIGGDLPSPRAPHRVWVRIGGGNSNSTKSVGLDASLIRSFPVMIFSSEKAKFSAAGLTEKLVSRQSQDLHAAADQARRSGDSTDHGVIVASQLKAPDAASEFTRLAAEADKCAANSAAHRVLDHVAVTLDEENACFRECAVCLGDYDEGERIKLLPPCGHRFHADCIDLWLSSKSTCPICRKDLRWGGRDEVGKSEHGEASIHRSEGCYCVVGHGRRGEGGKQTGEEIITERRDASTEGKGAAVQWPLH
ncbi:unnamed protein product [Closterium sp. Naga37s-1]|nr:unnamed protein product [Closterium sp. Naga37s-1]